MILRSIANSIMRNTKSLDEEKQRETAKVRELVHIGDYKCDQLKILCKSYAPLHCLNTIKNLFSSLENANA